MHNKTQSKQKTYYTLLNVFLLYVGIAQNIGFFQMHFAEKTEALIGWRSRGIPAKNGPYNAATIKNLKNTEIFHADYWGNIRAIAWQ